MVGYEGYWLYCSKDCMAARMGAWRLECGPRWTVHCSPRLLASTTPRASTYMPAQAATAF